MAQRTWRRLTLEVPSRDAEIAVALLGAATRESVALEQRDGARTVAASAYVSPARLPQALRRLRARLRVLAQEGRLRAAAVRHATLRDEDWSQTWKRHFRPFLVAPDLLITAPWQRRFATPRGVQVLCLDPGMAFGTGQHATTRLAVRWLTTLVKPGNVVIDAGCGSGIIGMAGASRSASVYAFDNDPIAVAATRLNFKRNGLRAAAVARADRIPSRFPKADIIVANITGEALQRLASALVAHLKPGGHLITSGITAYNRLATLAAFAHARLAFVEERRDGEWFAYLHRKGGVRSGRAKLEEGAR
jgi:ribosomal protein L11 methyltransferase